MNTAMLFSLARRIRKWVASLTWDTLPGAEATDLCERCEEDKATISRALDYLETNGYLTCESKNVKRYKSPLILTVKGNEVGKKIADKISGVLDMISVGLTEEERIAFYRSLAIISDSLEAVSKIEE